MDRHHRRTHLHHRRVKREAPVITQIHYLTLKPTFSGPVAGYSTVLRTQNKPPTVKTTSSPPKPRSTKAPEKTQAPEMTQAPETTAKAESETPSPTKKPTNSPKSSTGPTETSSALTEEENSSIDVQTTTSSGSLTDTISASHTVGSALGSSTPTSIAINDGYGSSGPSLGGIIGGCAAAVVILLLVAIFFYRKRKQRAMNTAYGKTEDEKTVGLAGGAAGMGVISGAASINEKGSTVSLTPVAPFNPMLNPPAASPVVKTGPSGGTGGNGIPRKPIPPPLALSKPPQSDLRPSSSSSVSIPTVPVMPAAQPSPTLSAFSDGFVPGTPVAGPVDAAALAAAGKTAPVYRVQMEYSPSQADELELNIGGLVRMLHEYDDGWALCVRMDRSAQGVCPRTCLSTRPVKPRPNPAPGSPASQQRRGPPSVNGRSPQGSVSQNPQASQSPASSQRYIPYSDSRPGTPSQQRRAGTPSQQQRAGTPSQQQRAGTPSQQQRAGTPSQQQRAGTPSQQQRAGTPSQQQRAGTPSQQQGVQTPKAPPTTQSLPQITVTETETKLPEMKPEIQVSPAPEASTNANAPAFHAM